jgi:hypothetical protein
MTPRAERYRVYGVVLAAIVAIVVGFGVRLRADDPPLTVRITSPLGRTGTPGAVRIVARVERA